MTLPCFPFARRLPAILLLALAARADSSETVVWRLDDPQRIGGHTTTLVGAPQVRDGAIVFDGARDGVFVPHLPIAGARQFTIEVLFLPAADGNSAPRFVHVEDSEGRRALIELRLNSQHEWWLDTFMTAGPPARGVVLIDPKRRHPANRWHWAALRYDGQTLSHFVNGQLECESAGTFAPFSQGKVSLGVRQNLVSWFKGSIREVRFTRTALAPDQLQRVKP